MTTESATDFAATRKARGAFFTPTPITRFMSEWAIRSPDDRVLEPSCGDGAFLAASAQRLMALGGRTPLIAHELHEASAQGAASLLDSISYPGQVIVGDFLATQACAGFDVALGNPPFIRYQGFTGTARAAGLAAALAQGVRLSKLASSWAPFVIHASGFLAAHGRLALVLPAELLSANYAQEVRDYLLHRFSSLTIVVLGDQVFEGAQIEALLLLAEGHGGCDRVRFAHVERADALPHVSFDRELVVAGGQRWTGLRGSTSVQQGLADLTRSGCLTPLGTWGRLSLGAVTGNNGYFTLSPQQVRDLGLTASDVVPISPPGSTHLRALSLTKASHETLGRQGIRTMLFRPERPSEAALSYIKRGELQGVDQAYKCRVRAPWWRTPMPAPPDLFFTYMSDATPQLATNPAKLHYLNSVHGVYLNGESRDLGNLLPLACLNSATALSAELHGRPYGGGILKMEPREAVNLLVPGTEVVRSLSAPLTGLLPTARRLLKAGRLSELRELVDEIVLTTDALSADSRRHIQEAQQSVRESRQRRRGSGRVHRRAT